MRGVRQRKKSWLVLAACIGMTVLPTQSFAAQWQDTIGITFSEASPQPPPEPVERNNVIPLTINVSRTPVSRGRLPQTGGTFNQWQIIGLGCVLASFWLFLFSRLRKEATDD
ncbi:LPXTG cell wall anchor domain-containing protein [Enterococcus sp. AZ103]|uniref:LPXTG cell wall anchor domain-containing protein n=1 Tax=Enterococcus sp. AZ103 TaxID=2774628 RepID=UPI003F685D88